jgi:alginate O-acetyltransferase complex protein AlgI
MIFSSHLFIFYFLPLVLLLNYILPFRFLTLMLVTFSYMFYGWANPRWIVLLFTSTSIDYFCGLALVRFSGLPLTGPDLPMLPAGELRNRAQKIALAVSMISNLSLLGSFKYFDFAAANVNALGASLGWSVQAVGLLHIALPIGISFYTFQSMSYAIDVYRGEARPLRNFVDFACFVSLFPHQLAGPIIRYATIAEQFRKRSLTYEKFARGVAFFCLGLSKKVLLANPMGHVADAAFGAGVLHWFDAWYGVIGYAFQIYFDFSAYSDMAVGMALMLGFAFTKNFDSPYRAMSITDFWRRWHISLSTWLRDYLYVPLGGSRVSRARTYANLMVVMLLGGLWHGAAWNFVVWGGIHGGMLAIERADAEKRNLYAQLPAVLRLAVTFVVVCIAWVFFRADTLGRAREYLSSLFGLIPAPARADLVAGTMYTPYHVVMFVLCGVIVWGAPQTWQFSQRLTPVRAAACFGLLAVSVLMTWTQTVNPFLYFQF